MNTVLHKIAADRTASDLDEAALVFMGDFVDRGPDSASVLREVRAAQVAAPQDVICLIGNHELMMQSFLEDPLGRGLRWLGFGGQETLRSFDIAPVSAKADGEAIMDAADALEDCLTVEGLLDWLRDQPLSWQSGNVLCVHAGLDPDLSPENHRPNHFAWGHRDFLTRPRNDGLWVVHGHTITKRPSCSDGRIAVDTGAFKGGKLTAAAVSKGKCRFLQS
ncbi:metallophosphoesterase [Aliiroseovarius sp. N1Y82]|nr:metallophosphoesterase [Aliiroseovarius subalbicans]